MIGGHSGNPRPLADGAARPRLASAEPFTVGWSAVRPAYDAVMVGSGAGGGVAACVLAEAGPGLPGRRRRHR
jgi:hypothetical protein